MMKCYINFLGEANSKVFISTENRKRTLTVFGCRLPARSKWKECNFLLGYNGAASGNSLLKCG